MSDTHSDAEFSDQELDIIRTTLVERYGHAVEIDLADAEMQLDPESGTVTTCPTVYWTGEECHFVVCKTAKKRFILPVLLRPGRNVRHRAFVLRRRVRSGCVDAEVAVRARVETALDI